jgi:hypothetical protein
MDRAILRQYLCIKWNRVPKTIGSFELTLNPRRPHQTLTPWLYEELPPTGLVLGFAEFNEAALRNGSVQLDAALSR